MTRRRRLAYDVGATNDILLWRYEDERITRSETVLSTVHIRPPDADPPLPFDEELPPADADAELVVDAPPPPCPPEPVEQLSHAP